LAAVEIWLDLRGSIQDVAWTDKPWTDKPWGKRGPGQTQLQLRFREGTARPDAAAIRDGTAT